jgi:hypothetical protein
LIRYGYPEPGNVVSIPSIRGIVPTHPRSWAYLEKIMPLLRPPPILSLAALPLATLPVLAEPPKSDADVPNWLDEHIAAFLPTAAEKHFDQIGRSTQILVAEALAKQHQRRVFLFTHKGRMAVGRC